MNDELEKIMRDGMRQARDNGAALVIELFEVYAEQGMCADCCLREVKRFLGETSYKPSPAITGQVKH
jgi:hypothetical protein